MNRNIRPKKTNIFTGIDIGSANIRAAIIDYDAVNNKSTLLDIGSAQSAGIKSGNIISREKLVEDIEKALTQAEKSANIKIDTVWLSVSGEHIRGINTQGAIAIDGADSGKNKIDENDVIKVLEMAKAISFPADREILHVLPQEYVVDVMEKIKEPIGISGRRLEARVHLVTVTSSAATNLINCAGDLGLEVGGLVFQGLASAVSTLDSDEKEMGVASINIGARTTDVVIYFEGGVYHSGVIPIGSDSITNDIAVMLNISRNEAEKLKLKYGSAKSSLASSELMIDIKNSENGKTVQISENQLAQYIEARMIEIFQLIGRELSRTDIFTKLAYGLVITGGGALLPNTAVLGEEILGMRVRIGAPRGISSNLEISNKPDLTGAIGLAMWSNSSDDITFDVAEPFSLKTFFKKISGWFKGFF